MKIEKAQAIAFLVALGFSKAADWSDEKIIERLDKAPNKVNEEDVPEGFEELFGRLVNSTADDKIELVSGKGEKKAKKPTKEKPAEKEEPKGKKPTKEKPAEKPTAKTAEHDEYGSRVGTISSKVNAVLADEWDDEEAIAKAAGVTLDQARGRLYYAAQEGVVEVRRLVQYRLKKQGKE